MGLCENVGDKFNIILGKDFPEYGIGYEENRERLNQMDFAEALVLGYMMWSLVKAAVLEDFSSAFNKKPVSKNFHTRESDFGKILIICNNKSLCTKPEDYEHKFNNVLKNNRELIDSHTIMVSSLIWKIGDALANGKKLKFVEEYKVTKFQEVLLEEDLGMNFNGYPLENGGKIIERIRDFFNENQCRRFTKNRNYKLKLIIEEY